MRNFTWNRFPIKNLLIDSLLTPIVENTHQYIFCNFETWHQLIRGPALVQRLEITAIDNIQRSIYSSLYCSCFPVKLKLSSLFASCISLSFTSGIHCTGYWTTIYNLYWANSASCCKALLWMFWITVQWCTCCKKVEFFLQAVGAFGFSWSILINALVEARPLLVDALT